MTVNEKKVKKERKQNIGKRTSTKTVNGSNEARETNKLTIKCGAKLKRKQRWRIGRLKKMEKLKKLNRIEM